VGIYTIELDAGVVATLIPLGWLREVAETDRAAVGLAVTRALRELANWHHAPT
jgi:Arc/MetJ family transcription regulator